MTPVVVAGACLGLLLMAVGIRAGAGGLTGAVAAGSMTGGCSGALLSLPSSWQSPLTRKPSKQAAASQSAKHSPAGTLAHAASILPSSSSSWAAPEGSTLTRPSSQRLTFFVSCCVYRTPYTAVAAAMLLWLSTAGQRPFMGGDQQRFLSCSCVSCRRASGMQAAKNSMGVAYAVRSPVNRAAQASMSFNRPLVYGSMHQTACRSSLVTRSHPQIRQTFQTCNGHGYACGYAST